MRRLRRMPVGTTARAATMLVTVVTFGRGWWPGDAELAYRALITFATVLATVSGQLNRQQSSLCPMGGERLMAPRRTALQLAAQIRASFRTSS